MKIYYYWDYEDGWIEHGKYKLEYTYDNNGNETMYISYYWDDETNDWIKDRKHEYTYDNNGNCTMEIYYYWNYEDGWIEHGKYKSEYTYDNNGNCTMKIPYDWTMKQMIG